MINFTHPQVISDSFQMSLIEFIETYRGIYSLSKIQCKIIWSGVREECNSWDRRRPKTRFLKGEELEKIKKEVLISSPSSQQQRSIEDILNDSLLKTKKKKVIALYSELGLTVKEIQEYLSINYEYLVEIIDLYKNVENDT